MKLPANGLSIPVSVFFGLVSFIETDGKAFERSIQHANVISSSTDEFHLRHHHC